MSREELCKLCERPESPILCRPGVSMKILKAPDRSAAAAAAREAFVWLAELFLRSAKP